VGEDFIEIPPLGHGWYRASPIEIVAPVERFSAQGKLNYKVTYRRKGSNKNAFADRRLSIGLDKWEDSAFQIGQIGQISQISQIIWNDA